jgi:hypothetical protein
MTTGQVVKHRVMDHEIYVVGRALNVYFYRKTRCDCAVDCFTRVLDDTVVYIVKATMRDRVI